MELRNYAWAISGLFGQFFKTPGTNPAGTRPIVPFRQESRNHRGGFRLARVTRKCPDFRIIRRLWDVWKGGKFPRDENSGKSAGPDRLENRYIRRHPFFAASESHPVRPHSFIIDDCSSRVIALLSHRTGLWILFRTRCRSSFFSASGKPHSRHCFTSSDRPVYRTHPIVN